MISVKVVPKIVGHTQRKELIRLIITGLLSANVMMLSWALYAGFFTRLSSDAVSKISLPIVAMAVSGLDLWRRPHAAQSLVRPDPPVTGHGNPGGHGRRICVRLQSLQLADRQHPFILSTPPAC
jgi:hypothetical protein